MEWRIWNLAGEEAKLRREVRRVEGLGMLDKDIILIANTAPVVQKIEPLQCMRWTMVFA